MSSQKFEEIGSHARPDAYDDCGHVKCVVCGAPVGCRCVNPCTGLPRRLPCIGRVVRRAAPAEELRKRQEGQR